MSEYPGTSILSIPTQIVFAAVSFTENIKSDFTHPRIQNSSSLFLSRELVFAIRLVGNRGLKCVLGTWVYVTSNSMAQDGEEDFASI